MSGLQLGKGIPSNLAMRSASRREDAAFASKLAKCCTHTGWWATLEKGPRRRSQEQHVLHLSGPREHDVQIQPPVTILHATVRLLNARAVDCDTFTQRLALRCCGGEIESVRQLEAQPSHMMRLRAPPSKSLLCRFQE